MKIRSPVVAGQCYPGSRDAASTEVRKYLDLPINEAELANHIVGGIVPHAGWAYSGAVAAKVFKAIALQRKTIETVVMFGAVHRYGLNRAAICVHGTWDTPLGPMAINEHLAEDILAGTDLIADKPSAHDSEHSIEVQLPFIQVLFPEANFVPIMVPPHRGAGRVGKVAARAILALGVDAVCIGSSDLTHYGPSYGFTPKGTGPGGIRWAKQVNDRQLLDSVAELDPQAVLDRAGTSQSACGAGAIAATIGAAIELGAETAKVLEHTTSAEVSVKRYGSEMTDSVGYAAIVFGSA